MASLPSYIDPELWSAFMETRKAMKVPFTPAAQRLVIRKLMKMHADGWDVNASLEKSTVYGYRGVFEVEKIDKTPARDPTLVKLEEDAKRAVPPPPEVAAKLAGLIEHMRVQ